MSVLVVCVALFGAVSRALECAGVRVGVREPGLMVVGKLVPVSRVVDVEAIGGAQCVEVGRDSLVALRIETLWVSPGAWLGAGDEARLAQSPPFLAHPGEGPVGL